MRASGAACLQPSRCTRVPQHALQPLLPTLSAVPAPGHQPVAIPLKGVRPHGSSSHYLLTHLPLLPKSCLPQGAGLQ